MIRCLLALALVFHADPQAHAAVNAADGGTAPATVDAVLVAPGNTDKPPAVSATDFTSGSLDAGGLTVPYRLYSPPRLAAGARYPLIVFLHGIGQRGDDNQAQLSGHGGCQGSWAFLGAENQAKQPCFFVAPQCPKDRDWRDGQLIANVAAIIERQLLAKLPIDPDRVYVTGVSLGGGGTYSMIAAHPGLFACAIPQSSPWNAPNIADFKHIPLWCFHAQDDWVAIAEDDRIVDELRKAGANPIYTRYRWGSHEIWEKAYSQPGLFDWMIAQRRGKASTAPPSLTIVPPRSRGGPFTGTVAAPGRIFLVTWFDADAAPNVQGATATSTATPEFSAWSITGTAIRPGATRLRVDAIVATSMPEWGGNTTCTGWVDLVP